MLQETTPGVNPTLQPGLFDSAIQAPLLTLEDQLDAAIARTDERIIENVRVLGDFYGITDTEEAAYLAYVAQEEAEEEEAGAAAYMRAMMDEGAENHRSVNWNGVYSVLDEMHADALYVDQCQSEYTDWRG